MASKISIDWGSLVSAYWVGLKISVFDSYRPELHYMRGPIPREACVQGHDNGLTNDTRSSLGDCRRYDWLRVHVRPTRLRFAE